MSHKKLIYTGLAISAASFLLGTAGTFFFIYSSFFLLAETKNAGISAVSAAINYAIFTVAFEAIGILIGFALMIVGFTKAKRKNKLL